MPLTKENLNLLDKLYEEKKAKNKKDDIADNWSNVPDDNSNANSEKSGDVTATKVQITIPKPTTKVFN
jgi:hypothetical protein